MFIHRGWYWHLFYGVVLKTNAIIHPTWYIIVTVAEHKFRNKCVISWQRSWFPMLSLTDRQQVIIITYFIKVRSALPETSKQAQTTLHFHFMREEFIWMNLINISDYDTFPFIKFYLSQNIQTERSLEAYISIVIHPKHVHAYELHRTSPVFHIPNSEVESKTLNSWFLYCYSTTVGSLHYSKNTKTLGSIDHWPLNLTFSIYESEKKITNHCVSFYSVALSQEHLAYRNIVRIND